MIWGNSFPFKKIFFLSVLYLSLMPHCLRLQRQLNLNSVDKFGYKITVFFIFLRRHKLTEKYYFLLGNKTNKIISTQQNVYDVVKKGAKPLKRMIELLSYLLTSQMFKFITNWAMREDNRKFNTIFGSFWNSSLKILWWLKAF